MATTVTKVTAIFRTDRSGWTETYYFSDWTGSVGARVIRFSTERLAVLGKQSILEGLRVSQSNNPKVVTLHDVNKTGVARAEANDNPDSDQASAAILIPFRSTTGARRFVTLRGVPDSWVKHEMDSTDIKLSNFAKPIVELFRDYLLQAPGLQIRDRVPDPANPFVGIVKVELDLASGFYKITTDGTAPPAEGQQVVFLKMKGNNLQGLKGIRRVVGPITDDTFLVDRGMRTDLGLIRYLGGGKYQKYVTDFFGADKVDEPFKVSTRKAGRPFSARRGRARASK